MPSLLRVSCVPLVNPQLLLVPWGDGQVHTPLQLCRSLWSYLLQSRAVSRVNWSAGWGFLN